MVTEKVVGFFLDVLATVLDWLPTFTLPESLSPTGLVAGVHPLAVALAAADPYLDATVLVVGAVAIVAAFLVAFAVKVARIVLSLSTGGGGSAA